MSSSPVAAENVDVNDATNNKPTSMLDRLAAAACLFIPPRESARPASASQKPCPHGDARCSPCGLAHSNGMLVRA